MSDICIFTQSPLLGEVKINISPDPDDSIYTLTVVTNPDDREKFTLNVPKRIVESKESIIENKIMIYLLVQMAIITAYNSFVDDDDEYEMKDAYITTIRHFGKPAILDYSSKYHEMLNDGIHCDEVGAYHGYFKKLGFFISCMTLPIKYRTPSIELVCCSKQFIVDESITI